MTTQQHSFDILSIARGYVAAGLSIIPIAAGTKEPASKLLPRRFDAESGETRPTWEPYQERLPNDADLKKWFARGDHGLAIVAGVVSGGLVVLDFDVASAYHDWRGLAEALVELELLDRLPVVRSANGFHVYFRMPEPISNRKLAYQGQKAIAETRGQGGYILAPPSRHPSGACYTVEQGNLCEVPLLNAAQAQALLDAARALQPADDHPASAGSTSTNGDVIGAFNAAHTIEAILEKHDYRCERHGRYIRPGGERGSIIIKDGRSTHFNPSDPLYRERPGGGYYRHTPFSAWCQLEHAGEVKAAVKAAAAQLGLSRPPSQAADQELLTQAGRVLGLAGGTNEDTWPYFIHAGAIWMHRHANDGTPLTPTPLCNFVARITAETVLNDGEHQEELYTITATCGPRSRTIDLKRAEFESEGAPWRISAALGARARIHPKTQPRYLIDAIKAFSSAATEQTIYTHTGWVQGRYLFANGYVDREGWHPGTDCQLPARLQQYQLQPSDDQGNALAVFNDLLDLAPASVMLPLVGGVLLAPIAHTIGAPTPMVHIYGPTGSHKTSIVCAALQLFGNFLPAKPTDSWTSTANSTQKLGWHLKNAPMGLDDFKIHHIKPQAVTFLLQNYGDNMARGRLDANSEARSAYPIRGVLISSGEDQPEGEASTLARILSVQLARGAVHRGKLTAVQRYGHHLHWLTVAYLRWLVGEPAVLQRNPQLHQDTRAAILARIEDTPNATNAGRVASNVATLHCAWETFGCFLVEQRYWPASRWEAWRAECKRVLFNLARAQIELTTNERYSQIFLDTLRGLVASGKAVLADLNATHNEELRPGQTLVGGHDHHGTFVIAQVAYDMASTHLRAAGRPVGFTLRALSQMLDSDGLLQSTHQAKNTIQKRINGVRAWCWHLPPDLLDS